MGRGDGLRCPSSPLKAPFLESYLNPVAVSADVLDVLPPHAVAAWWSWDLQGLSSMPVVSQEC